MNDAEPTTPPKHAATDIPPGPTRDMPDPDPATAASVLPLAAAGQGGPRVISWTAPPGAGPDTWQPGPDAPLPGLDAPHAPVPTPAGTAATPDADADAADDGVYVAADPRPPRGALRLVGVLAAVVAVAIAGTVTVWAVDRPGTLPEDVLPADGAAAFVRLDYDPTVGGAFTAYRFATAYSNAADVSPSQAPLSVGPLGWLLSPMLAGTTLTVRSDVEPWAGDKAGVMLREDGLVLVAIKLDGGEDLVHGFFDEYQTQTGVPVGYTVDRGYVVISDTTALTDLATGLAAGDGDLAGDPTYAADVQGLKTSRLGVVWASLSTVPAPRENTFSSIVRDAFDAEVGGVAGIARGALTAGSLLDRVYAEASGAEIEGRLVLGLSTRPDGIAIEGRLSGLTINGRVAGADTAPDVTPGAGLPEETVTSPSVPQGAFGVRAVPADTVMVAGVKGLDAGLAALVAPAADGAESGAAEGSPAEVPAAPEPAAPDPAVVDPAAGSAPATSAVAQAALLLGTDTAVGVLGGGGVIVRAAGTDPAAVAEAVIEATGDQPVAVLAEQGTAGTTSVVATGEVLDVTPLDNIPGFSRALPGIDDAIAVFYVNLDWATFTRDMDALGPFGSFGLGVSRSNVPGDFVVSGRLLIDELQVVPDGTPSVEASSPSPTATSSPVDPSPVPSDPIP